MLLSALGVTDEQFIMTHHYHGGSPDKFRDILLSAYQPFGRLAMRRVNTVIAVSDWERDRLRADFGINAVVIPNGVNTDRFASADIEE